MRLDGLNIFNKTDISCFINLRNFYRNMNYRASSVLGDNPPTKEELSLFSKFTDKYKQFKTFDLYKIIIKTNSFEFYSKKEKIVLSK